MKTITLNTFELNELTPEVQEKVISSWRDDDSLFDRSYWEDSLEAFDRSFPTLEIKDWRVEGFHLGYDYIKFEITDPDMRELKGESLQRFFKVWQEDVWGLNAPLNTACPLTGCVADESILDPIRAYMAAPDPSLTFEGLIKECLDAWVEAHGEGYKYWFSEESIRSDIEANEHVFFADGTLADRFVDSIAA